MSLLETLANTAEAGKAVEKENCHGRITLGARITEIFSKEADEFAEMVVKEHDYPKEAVEYW